MNTLPETSHTPIQDTAPIPQEQAEVIELDAKRTEHEAAEAKRKAEWDAKQQAKKAAEQEQLNLLQTMSDHDIMMAAISRIGTDTEKLTRRNMKDCVSEHIQTLSLGDPAFARLTMHPRKTMIRCFRFINRKAREFIEQEMKDNDMKPENGVYGGDVPDDMCYHWAEEYFRDTTAPEDVEKEDKFVPKTYTGKQSAKSKTKKSSAKKPDKATEKKPPADEPPVFPGQFSLFGSEGEVKIG